MSESDTETPVPALSDEASDETQPPASDPLKAATDFVRQNPGLTIAGAITAGLLAGALIPKRNRQRLIDGGNRLAKNAGTAGAAFSRSARERAEQTGSELRERSSAAGKLLEHLAEIAVAQTGKLIDSSEHTASRAGRNIARRAGELKSRMRR